MYRSIPLLLLLPGALCAQNVRSTLEIYDLDTHERTVVLRADDHFEAPNWHPDGEHLIVNAHGRLETVRIATGERRRIDTGFADKLNNDHGVSPDGTQLVISHADDPGKTNATRDWKTSTVYVLPIAGGTPRRITPPVSFWHGWSPDGTTLAYVAERNGEFDIYTIPVAGGLETRLTTSVGLDDGPDYSPDGRYLYYNSMAGGKMDIWVMNADGSEPRQLTTDGYSNWFPHPAPDGTAFVYLAYREDQGAAHPPMKEVLLRYYDLRTGSIRTLAEFTGGQGTINVPSWSPDGRRFAFVSYAWR